MRPPILVTRPVAQAAELATALRRGGFAVTAVPTVAIDAAGAARALDAMLDALDGADWLVLTSPNGAAALRARLAETGASLPRALRIAAVGPGTAATLRSAGLAVDHIPDTYRTVAIADGLGDVRARRVVLARADAATPDLRDALTARGAIVEEVVAYRTIEGPASSREALRTALGRGLAGIAFTSGSTVRGLLRLASDVDADRARRAPAFCIGPVTADEARRSGFEVAAVAEVHTAAGLAAAITNHHVGEDP